MLIAFFCLKLVSSARAKLGVRTLTDENFTQVISRRFGFSVNCVMFHGNSTENNASIEAFINASQKDYGMIRYYRLNYENCSSTYEYLKGKFDQIRNPMFVAYHYNGEDVYDGEHEESKIVNYLMRFIPNLAEAVDHTWVPGENLTVRNSAILFSSRPGIPPMWKSISCMFINTKLKFGFTNDEDLIKQFNVTETPCIKFIHNGIAADYVGNKTFDDVYTAIIDEFPEEINVIQSEPPPSRSKHVSDEAGFNATCKDKYRSSSDKKYCVIQTTKEQTEDVVAFSSKYASDPFKFINCGDTCPFPEMKTGFYLFHTRQDKVMYAEDISALELHIERFVGGNPKWDKMSDHFKRYQAEDNKDL